MKSRSGLPRTLALILLAAGVCTLSACGQQGPLYLPGDPMPHGKGQAKSPKGKVVAPALPPASAEPAAPATPARTPSTDPDTIVPVTPSIPD